MSDHKDGHRVKLGINAPTTVKILRSELEQCHDLYTSNTEQQYRPNGWEPSNEELRS